jgi:hypothetical protein
MLCEAASLFANGMESVLERALDFKEQRIKFSPIRRVCGKPAMFASQSVLKNGQYGWECKPRKGTCVIPLQNRQTCPGSSRNIQAWDLCVAQASFVVPCHPFGASNQQVQTALLVPHSGGGWTFQGG